MELTTTETTTNVHHLHVPVANHTLTVIERDATHDPTTGHALTGSWLWDSSLVLASHLATLHHLVNNATVLELGAGATGLPGVASVACHGAARCVLTDLGPLLPCLRLNALANGLVPDLQAYVRELRWGEQLETDLRIDVVLMSDVFYDPGDMPAMAATLRGVWREDDGGGGTVGWAASESRDGVEECVEVLREEGFEVDEVDRVTRPLLRDGEQVADFAVFRLRRRQSAAATAEVDFTL
uniref:Uncharacterized protein n=1 Tax=Leersia perrieri TaxID=77586 RepID=A0A0D9WAA7_9ORYZ